MIFKENEKIAGLDYTWEQVNDSIKNNKLLSIDLEFSRACNYRCKYCYASAGIRRENEMTLDEIKNIIDQAVALGVTNIVNIGGGEPLMYKHYWDVLKYEREKNVKTITFTNGWFITKEVAQKLADMNEDIALKMNSRNNEIQDFLADKKGAGEKIKEALNNLLEVGYTKKGGPKLAIETIVCKQNYDEIEGLYKFCRENNILPYMEVLTEQGFALENDIGVPIEKNYELFKKLLDYDQKKHNITWPLTPPIIGQTCKRMLYSAYITSTGNVQPCPGVEIETTESNIRNNSIAWIIKNTDVFQKVRNIYKHLKGPCKTCKYNDCYGCRGTALFQKNDFLESDPTCWHIKNKTTNE